MVSSIYLKSYVVTEQLYRWYDIQDTSEKKLVEEAQCFPVSRTPSCVHPVDPVSGEAHKNVTMCVFLEKVFEGSAKSICGLASVQLSADASPSGLPLPPSVWLIVLNWGVRAQNPRAQHHTPPPPLPPLPQCVCCSGKGLLSPVPKPMHQHVAQASTHFRTEATLCSSLGLPEELESVRC